MPTSAVNIVQEIKCRKVTCTVSQIVPQTSLHHKVSLLHRDAQDT